MTKKFEDLFEKPLSEYSREELLTMANKIKAERKFPAAKKSTTGKKSKVNPVDQLVNELIQKEAK